MLECLVINDYDDNEFAQSIVDYVIREFSSSINFTYHKANESHYNCDIVLFF